MFSKCQSCKGNVSGNTRSDVIRITTMTSFVHHQWRHIVSGNVSYPQLWTQVPRRRQEQRTQTLIELTMRFFRCFKNWEGPLCDPPVWLAEVVSLPEASVRGQPEGRVLVEHLAVQVHADVSLHVLGTVIEHLQKKKAGSDIVLNLFVKCLKFWGGLGLVKKVKDRLFVTDNHQSLLTFTCVLCAFFRWYSCQIYNGVGCA